MRVLIAPDKFKGTLTARQAAEAIARGWRQARPDDRLALLPISDGGDGFGAVMGAALDAKPQRIKTVDAAHRPVTAIWWWQPERRVAVIESANIIGLALLPAGEVSPVPLGHIWFGRGGAGGAETGARQVIIGIGGSATNDGGFGLARALGWKFFNRTGGEIVRWTELGALQFIEPPDRRLPKGFITVAVDVQNPLLGRCGATRVFGPQKGLLPRDLIPAERCLRRLALVGKRELGVDFSKTPGAGAAGGLGFGLAAFGNGRFVSGFALFAQRVGLARVLARTDLVVTGEGALDRSTLMGKGAGQIARLGRERKLPVIGLAGMVQDPSSLRNLFHNTRALTELTTVDNARRQANVWLERLAFQVATNMRVENVQSGLASLRAVAKLAT